MKKTFDKYRKYMLLYTFLYMLLFFICKCLLRLFDLVFLSWVNNISIIIIALGIITGTFQLIKQSNWKKKIKLILIPTTIIAELLFIGIFCFIYVLFTDFDRIVVRDDKLMLKKEHSVLFSNWVNYYDYKNIFVRSKKIKIIDAYDDTITTKDYLYTIYYDDKGNVIKKDHHLIESVPFWK